MERLLQWFLDLALVRFVVRIIEWLARHGTNSFGSGEGIVVVEPMQSNQPRTIDIDVENLPSGCSRTVSDEEKGGESIDTLESEPDGVKIDVDMLLMMAQAAIDAANKILQKDPLAENKNDVKDKREQQENVRCDENDKTKTDMGSDFMFRRPVAETKFYDLLGVSPYATDKELKKAYQKTALRVHPDKQAQLSVATVDDRKSCEKMQLIGDIYNVLSNRELRFLYDNYGENFVNKFKQHLI